MKSQAQVQKMSVEVFCRFISQILHTSTGNSSYDCTQWNIKSALSFMCFKPVTLKMLCVHILDKVLGTHVLCVHVCVYLCVCVWLLFVRNRIFSWFTFSDGLHVTIFFFLPLHYPFLLLLISIASNI